MTPPPGLLEAHQRMVKRFARLLNNAERKQLLRAYALLDTPVPEELAATLQSTAGAAPAGRQAVGHALA